SLCSFVFFFSSRRRHTRFSRDWSSDVCSSDLSSRPSPSYLNGIMMRDVLMDSLFWTIVMPWFLFLGLFLVPKKPSWLRNYAFPRSEERRVGKECRSRGGGERGKRKWVRTQMSH